MERVVLKVGSGVVYGRKGTFAGVRFGGVAAEIAWIRKHSVEALCIVSGAVALGAHHRLIEDDDQRRHAAAVGQIDVICGVSTVFSRYDLIAAQLLLQMNVDGSIRDAKRIQRTVDRCLLERYVPVLNGNDPTSALVNNDILAVRLAELVSADRIVIITTKRGSPYSVGGGQTKKRAMQMAEKIGIPLHICDASEPGSISKFVL